MVTLTYHALCWLILACLFLGFQGCRVKNFLVARRQARKAWEEYQASLPKAHRHH